MRLTQLQPEERMTLASLRQQGHGLRNIAELMGRSANTLSGELRRNSSPDEIYGSLAAHRACQARRGSAQASRKLDADGHLWPLVAHMPNLLWSLQQIARTLQRIRPPVRPELHVSHVTIYNAIYAYPRGGLRKALIASLRPGQTTFRPRSAGTDRRGQIPEMVSIHVTRPEVENRQMPRHWEVDLTSGAYSRFAVGALVERTTRLVLLAWMLHASAQSALADFAAKLHSIATPIRQTLAYDKGKQMARHRGIARATNMRVYFCDPHSP